MKIDNRETLKWIIYNDSYIPSPDYRRRSPRKRGPDRYTPFTPPPGRPWRLIEAKHGSTVGFFSTQQKALEACT